MMREKHNRRLTEKWLVLFFILCAAAVLLVCLAVYLYTVDSGVMVVSYLDVGQGDAELVSLPNGGHILIDGGDVGSGDYVLRPYLTKKGIRKLDAVFLSHLHSDHVAGVIELLEAGYPVDRIYLCPEAQDGTELDLRLSAAVVPSGAQIIYLDVGEQLRYEGVEIQNLTPMIQKTGAEENDRSMILRLGYGESSFLFTGDIGVKTEEALLYRPEIKADVLKVAHHGSSGSTSLAFLDAVRPDYAVIGVAEGNQYHLPSAKTLRRLSRGGLMPFRTDLDGTVEFIATEDGIQQIRTARRR